MALFFKLKERIYKVGNKVIIGRGAPFDDLNLDRDIARAHCLIVQKQGKYTLKSLDSSAQTYVNGQRLKTGKITAVSPEDEILIGQHKLEILNGYEGKDYTPIRRFNSYLNKYDGITFLQKFALISIGIFALSFLSGGEKDNLGISIFVSCSVGLVGAAMLELSRRFIGGIGAVKAKEVIVGETGLTIHYEASNMSIKYEDIEQVSFKKNILNIQAHNENFEIGDIKSLEKLHQVILRRAPKSSLQSNLNSNQSDKKQKTYVLTLIGSLALANGVLFYMVEDAGREKLMEPVSAFVVLGVSLAFRMSPFGLTGNSKNQKSITKASLVLGLVIFSLALEDLLEYFGV